MLTEIYIYKAADAFLYLPVYIAQEHKIFKSLLKDESISIHFPKLENEGDIIAIQEMLKLNSNAIHNKRKNIIPICIADPTAFLSKKIDSKFDIDQCVVLGALINKLPFWAVDSNDALYCETFEQLCAGFTDVVHYDKNLITGFHLYKRFAKERENCTPHPVKKFGKEFDVLTDTLEEIKESGDINRTAVVLTADIVSVAEGLLKKEQELDTNFSLNYYFSKEKESLISTGILTTRHVVDKKENHFIPMLWIVCL